MSMPTTPVCTIRYNPSPVSTPGGGACGGSGGCGGVGVGVDAGAGIKVLTREQSLELGVLDIVAGGGGHCCEARKSESVRSWVTNDFVVSLYLAHATDSWGHRVVGEGRRATFEARKPDVFDGWP